MSPFRCGEIRADQLRHASAEQGAASGVAPVIVSAPSSSPAPPLLRVLLVEDHEDTREILRRLMTRWGHSVTTASAVAEARSALAAGTFDLLLSDFGLPDGTGLDVIAALRERSEIPAIAMSGYGMETDRVRTCAAGFSEHIVKPVDAALLRELLTRLAPPPAPPDRSKGDP